jgi:hypothetical protein
MVFDALFGLATIALTDSDARHFIIRRIQAQSEVRADRPIARADFVPIAYRSAANCLSRKEGTTGSDRVLLAQLSWRPESL